MPKWRRARDNNAGSYLRAGIPLCQAIARARVLITIGTLFAALLISLAGESNFLTLYSKFNEQLLYLMVPWTAVNLVDYYLIHFGNYDVPWFFSANGSIYGQHNVEALWMQALEDKAAAGKRIG